MDILGKATSLKRVLVLRPTKHAASLGRKQDKQPAPRKGRPTWWEARAYVVLWTAKLLRVKLRDLYDSYPYNPLRKSEVNAAFEKAKKGGHMT